MRDRLRLDIETYCELDLKQVGVYRYVEHPSFLILMAAWAVNDDPVQVAFGDDIPEIPGLWTAPVKVAHNAQFERVCFSMLDHQITGGPWPAFLPAEEWHDTAAVAAERGYPQDLRRLAEWLDVEAKDEAGTRLINFFCKPNRKGQRNLPEDHPEKWAEFVEYCRQDVVVLREVDKALGRWPTQTERLVWLADQRINDRGIRVDLPMVQEAIRAGEENTRDNLAEMGELTGVANPNSAPQLLAWFQEQGLKSMGDMRAETVKRVLKGKAVNSGSDKANTVKRVLELRQETALTTGSKYTAAERMLNEDQRLRGMFRFFGAHTGRWSGKGVQLQNLARVAIGSHGKAEAGLCSCGRRYSLDHEARANAAEVEAHVLDLLLGGKVDDLTLKKLVRSMFLLDGVVVDYSAIEARVIAWLAGEEWALQAFREGRDIYVETAERMGRVLNTTFTRSQGKVAVLALGYNGGIGSLRAMGAEGDDDDLLALVTAWRTANPAIVALWSALGDAFRHGGTAGRLRVDVDGRDRRLVLPSGRALVYHDVRLDERFRVKVGEVDGKPKYRAKVSDGFANPNKDDKGPRIMTYGGRLSENATQAAARDLLAEALVRLERAGYKTVGHVHDEAMVEDTTDVAGVIELMCRLPDWADGLPVAAEGFTTSRYRKG